MTMMVIICEFCIRRKSMSFVVSRRGGFSDELTGGDEYYRVVWYRILKIASGVSLCHATACFDGYLQYCVMFSS